PVGVERSRQQVVDRDVVARDAAREAGDKTGEAGTRTIGHDEKLYRRLHGPRGDVDDAAELARDHAVDRRLDELDRRQHVRVERADPRGAIPIAEITRRRAARIVDEDVGLPTGGKRLFTALGCGDVARDPSDYAPDGSADFGGGRAKHVLVAGDDGNFATRMRERGGGARAQAFGRGAHRR